LNEKIQRSIFNYFSKNGIENFVGVPDSTMKYFIEQGLEQKKILITTREEEAIGIGVGFSISKSPSIIFMQNAGFGNSISTITSLVQMYEIPLIFIIGWRGYKKNDAPEHLGFGQIQNELLRILNIPFKIFSENNWKKSCNWALNNLHKNNSCALIIKREHE
jgi:sulfopyruvate decarboxylase TPP-binding subunit